MSDCSVFEVAIDRRLFDALSAEESAALDAHIAGCDPCRAYEKAARATQLDLHALAAEAERAVDWDDLERRIRARSRERLQKLAGGVVLGVCAVALTVWGFAPPHGALLFGVEVGALVGVVVLARVVGVTREVNALSRLERGEELLARHRAMIERQLRTMRRFRWIALGVVLVNIALALAQDASRQALTYVGLAIIVTSTWLHSLLVIRPRLQRELATLEPADRR